MVCDYCQHTSDFDSCQFILIQIAYKVSISARSNVTFDISLHEVCVRVGGLTLCHNQISSDGNFLTMVLCWRALCACESSTIKSAFFKTLLKTLLTKTLNESDFYFFSRGWCHHFIHPVSGGPSIFLDGKIEELLLPGYILHYVP